MMFSTPQVARVVAECEGNMTTHAAERAEYLKRLRTDPRLNSTLAPIGHGMELTVRL